MSPNQRIHDSGPLPDKPAFHKGSGDEIERRRTQIILIRENIYRERRVANDWDILEGLAKLGFHIDRRTLQRDMLVIDKDNKFVLNLASINYNKIIEDMFDNIDLIIQDCNDIMAKKWTNSKIITTEEESDDPNHLGTRSKQKVITDELAGPRLKANEIKGQMMKLYADIFKGGIVDAGIALVQRDANSLKHTLLELRATIKQKDDLIEELKSGVMEAKQQ